MGHGRLAGVLVAAAVLAASIGLTAAPASADAPSTVPNITAPTGLSTVAGDVTVSALTSVSTPTVQFYWNDTHPIGVPVAVDIAGNASVTWPTWSLPDGNYTVTAADCNSDGCNATQATPVQVTLTNTPPTITAPAPGNVSGDVVVSATTAAPSVQFYLDTVAFGTPVATSAGSASVTWHTWSLPDGAHAWTAAECDTLGCNPTQSTPSVDVTIVNPAPTLTPADGSSVSGVVNVTATTAAPFVQFALGGVAFGAPVAVSAGSASVPWTTWGLANGPNTWTATACDGVGCNAATATAHLTLSNTAPAITAPTDGAEANASVEIDATAAGGGLAFFVDGVQVGFDAAAPYTFTVGSPLASGSHTASVIQCDTTGAICNGPSSPTVTFVVGRLNVSIVSVAPNPFSPGRDGHRDSTAFRVHISTPQHVVYAVRDANGHTLLGPVGPAGVLPAGSRNFVWDGRSNSGKVVSDGMYSIVVTTASANGLHGTATAKVVVDHSPTRFFAIRGNQATLYPVADGFLDSFRPSVHVTEGGRLSLAISKPNGTRVRLIVLTHAAKGTFSLGWNGRNTKNVLMPAGNYRFRFFAVDRAGNQSTSRLLLVHLSHRRTTRKTVIVTRTGDVGRTSATNSYCTQYSLGLSSFRHGLWLDNSCDRGFDGLQHIYADYVLSVPGSVQYDTMRVKTVGQTIHAPEPISAFVYNFTESKWDPAGSMSLRKSKTRVTTFRSVSGAHHVSLRHKVKIRIAVPDMVTPEDYDVASASIVVTYRVLQ